jgi:hypothetical protein
LPDGILLRGGGPRQIRLFGLTSLSVGPSPFILDCKPTLAISNAGPPNLILTWASPAAGFNVYQATNLAQPAWLKITNVITSSGTIFQATIAATNINTFYRLSSP